MDRGRLLRLLGVGFGVAVTVGELAAAEPHPQRVLAREGGHAIANLVMGLVRIKQEHHAEARGFREPAIATDPLLGKAHYQLGPARLASRRAA